jgi:hypothetical protein
MFAVASGGGEDWADRFGGPLAVALLAAEVSALGAHLNARGSAMRARAVDALAVVVVWFASHSGVAPLLAGAVVGGWKLVQGRRGTAGPVS